MTSVRHFLYCRISSDNPAMFRMRPLWIMQNHKKFTRIRKPCSLISSQDSDHPIEVCIKNCILPGQTLPLSDLKISPSFAMASVQEVHLISICTSDELPLTNSNLEELSITQLKTRYLNSGYNDWGTKILSLLVTRLPCIFYYT